MNTCSRSWTPTAAEIVSIKIRILIYKYTYKTNLTLVMIILVMHLKRTSSKSQGLGSSVSGYLLKDYFWLPIVSFEKLLLIYRHPCIFCTLQGFLYHVKRNRNRKNSSNCKMSWPSAFLHLTHLTLYSVYFPIQGHWHKSITIILFTQTFVLLFKIITAKQLCFFFNRSMVQFMKRNWMNFFYIILS